MAAVLSTFLFMARSGVSIQNYSDMEAQSRRAVEIFAEDARQASAISWASGVNLTLTVNGLSVTYAYIAATHSFERTDGGGTQTLLTGIAPGSFRFSAFNLAGTPLALGSAAELAAAGINTKQLQIALKAIRASRTAATSTNNVLSVRFILRNKIVTA